jgi:hypothetical protein
MEYLQTLKSALFSFLFLLLFAMTAKLKKRSRENAIPSLLKNKYLVIKR